MPYETSVIRKFMLDHLSDDDINALSYDYLRPAHNQFSQGMSRGQKIQVVLEYCDEHDCQGNLLAALQIHDLEQYQQHFTSIVIEPAPGPQTRQRQARQIFMCHAHQDGEFAHRLAGDLAAQGWKVWIAPDSIHPGEKWVDAIERGLEECGIFIIALTPAAVKSKWVTIEANAVLTVEHQEPVQFIPVEVQPCNVPMLWAGYQRISFRDYEAGLNKLLAALESVKPAAGERPANPHTSIRPAVPPWLSRLKSLDLKERITFVLTLIACAATLIMVPEVRQLLGLTEPIATATPTPGSLPTVTSARAPTSTMTPSRTPSITPSATDTPTFTPTSVPTIDTSRAVANQNAGVFLAPNGILVDSVRPGQAVTVLGRADLGDWLYVQTISGKQGFAYRPLFDWPGDILALTPVPIPDTPTPSRTPVPIPDTPTPSRTPVRVPVTMTSSPTVPPRCPSDRTGFIGIDFYPIGDPFCTPRPGYHLYLRGQGDLHPFKYYVAGKKVYEGNDQYTFDYYLAGNTRVHVAAVVEACDGRRVEKLLDLKPVICR
jgi:hypothetical protein